MNIFSFIEIKLPRSQYDNVVDTLKKHVELRYTCGYLTMLCLDRKNEDNCNNNDIDTNLITIAGNKSFIFNQKPYFKLIIYFNTVFLDNNANVDSMDDSLTWLPMELVFGLPLFDSELNSKICNKVRQRKSYLIF